MTEEKEIFHRHIQRAGLKRTAQRDLILEVFLRTEEHMSSEDLYRLVQRDDPTVGQTTVYRTLKLLVDAGLARDEAYALVQRNALRAWDEELDFRTLVEADPAIAGRLARDALAAAFDLDDALRHTNVLFERLGALRPREAVHA